MTETKKNTVLIVDDEHSNIMALTHILSSDYEIYAEKDGKGAIETAEELLPDIILLDILMPEMDGYEVISVLKNSEKTKDIPVIFITGLKDSDDERKGLASGAADYITKPFSPAIVGLRVNNQIKMLNQLRTIEWLSMTDQLTGLPNRRSFDSRLNIEWNKARREQKPVSILVLDVDNFKKYNDTHGHQQGDVALQTVGNALRQSLKRPTDFAARWGGEEFIALLANTDKSTAVEIAETLRRNIEAAEIPCENESGRRVSVSIGVNTASVGEHINEFISRADTALYEAKSQGRNRVCCC